MILETGMVVSGRYEILSKIGAGGMAVVYKAKDLKLDRAVTLKVMREEYMSDQEFIARFQVEARAAAGLSKANIVNVYDVGQEEHINYIVMEYVDGVTLKDLIQRKAPFRNDETLGVAIQIASALAEAHSNGVIHRDIKPQNILVTDQGVIKVTDFGIAKAAGASTLTTGSNTMGSVHYLSPEQARGVYVDNKSDIYSLGIVMFEMATGQMPFEGESPVAVAIKQIDEPLPDIKSLNPGVSESLIKIIQKAASKNTISRYQTAEDLLADLRRAISDDGGAFIEDTVRHVKYSNQDEEENIKYQKAASIDPADEKALERKIILAAIVTSLAIIALISSIFVYNQFQNRLIPQVVPSIYGMTVDDATALLSELNMKPIVLEHEYNSEYPEGQICRQDVPPDAILETNPKNIKPIQIHVSLGVEKTTVPNVTDKEVSEAKKMISESFLVPKEEEEFSDVKPENIIIRQDPPAGSEVEKYTDVTIVRSLGPEKKFVKVPNIEGKLEAVAIGLLQDIGLVVGHPDKSSSNEIPAGYIISQSVSAGTELEMGMKVSYVISTGPSATPTPAASPAPAKKTKPLLVRTPVNVELPVHLRVLKIADGMGEPVYDGIVYELPFVLDVTGTGSEDFQIYQVIDDGSSKLVAEETIDFGETEG